MVIGVIIAVLAIAVPAFNALSKEQRVSQARQIINAALIRAHTTAVADRTRVAVRFAPAEWEIGEQGAQASPGELRGRQALVTYGWSGSVHMPQERLPRDGYFERLPERSPALLPADVWAAPSEALLAPGRMVVSVPPNENNVRWSERLLTGRIGDFALDGSKKATNQAEGEELLPADDFLVIFNETGAVEQAIENNIARVWPLRAYDPRPGFQTESAGDGWIGRERRFRTPFQRFNSTGVVIYRREPFEKAGRNAQANVRRPVLERFGTVFYVDRGSGGLVSGGVPQ